MIRRISGRSPFVSSLAHVNRARTSERPPRLQDHFTTTFNESEQLQFFKMEKDFQTVTGHDFQGFAVAWNKVVLDQMQTGNMESQLSYKSTETLREFAEGLALEATKHQAKAQTITMAMQHSTMLAAAIPGSQHFTPQAYQNRKAVLAVAKQNYTTRREPVSLQSSTCLDPPPPPLSACTHLQAISHSPWPICSLPHPL